MGSSDNDPLLDSLNALFPEDTANRGPSVDEVSNRLKSSVSDLFPGSRGGVDGSTSDAATFLANYAKHTVGISNPEHFKHWLLGVLEDAKSVGIVIGSPDGLKRYIQGGRQELDGRPAY